jgi:flagellin-like hook-associated protein FlgL
MHMSKLYEDSLKLTINKNLSDIRILLTWAEEASDVKEKIQHSEQALRYLAEAVESLREIQRT